MNLKSWPLWLRCGLVSIVVLPVIVILTGGFKNPDVWYNAWFTLPWLIVFGSLSAIFRMDFVSNYYPSEGPWRLIVLLTLSFLSLFLVAFVMGAIIGLVISFLKKRIKRSETT